MKAITGLLLVIGFVARADSLDDQLETAKVECSFTAAGCRKLDAIQAKVDERDSAQRKSEAEWRERRQKEVNVKADAQIAEGEREEAEADAKLRAKCGKDYGHVRVGMRWTRVQECAGPFEIKAQDERGTVYEADGGLVRVEHGRVTRWVAK